MNRLNEKEDSEEILRDIKVVGRKLFTMLEVAMEKMDSRSPDENQKSKLHLSLLAYIQLMGQIKEMEANIRDVAFRSAGPSATSKDAEGLKRALNFSDWAYDEDSSALQEHLESENFKLLRHDLKKQVGYVGHFIAINPEQKEALVGIKGSSTLEDLLTDICALSVTYKLERPFVKNGKMEMRCHEGILKSSVGLADVLEPWMEHLFLPLDYKILLCGHSLGAGAACLVAPILRSRIPALQSEGRMNVVAFASPPVMDYQSALACAPWTRTVVNNSDVIPRCSLGNLEVFVSILENVHETLEEKEIIKRKDSFGSHMSIFKRLTNNKSEMLMSAEEARQVIRAAQSEVTVDQPDNLCVPGRIMVLYENWKDQVKNEHTEKGESNNVEKPRPRVGSSMTNGIASVLRYIEMDEHMVSDHFTASYHERVDALKPKKVRDENCNVM